MLQQQLDFNAIRACDILSAAPQTIGPDALAVEALTMMRAQSISQLLVLENGAYLGIVHLHDLIREGLV
jgi:arabinose-5-phosphate isomerase